MSQQQPHGVKDRVLAEASQFLVVFAYIWLLLGVFGLHKAIVLSDEHIVHHQGFAILKALAFAKIVFIAEELNLGKSFENKPLIWRILFTSILFSALLIGFDLLETAALERFWPRAAASGDGDIGTHDPRVLLAAGVVTFVALIPFFGIRELGKVLGQAPLHDLLFKSRTKFVPVLPETQQDHRHNDYGIADEQLDLDRLNGNGPAYSIASKKRSAAMFGLHLPRLATTMIAGAFLVVGLLLSIVYLWSPHATLRLTTGLPGSTGQRFISAFVAVSTKAHPRVRFQLVPVANLKESSKALEERKVDLAIVRSDVSPPANGQTIAILRRDVVAIVLPSASPIKDMSRLAGKAIAIPEGPMKDYNSKTLDTILSYFNISPEAVKRVFLPLSEIGLAVHRKHVAAALAVGPIGPGEAVDVVAAVAKATKGAPEILAIDQADAIGKRFPGFESIDVPDGAFKGRPPTPNDTVKSLAVSYRFVAPETMLNVVAGVIGKSIFATKAKLMAATPLASQIEAPDPDDKNPILPVHPGVAAYLASGDQSFLEAFQQYLYVVGIPLSLAGSFFAVVVGLFRNRKLVADQSRVYRLLVVADAARTAAPFELETLETEFHAIVASCVNQLAQGSSDAGHLPVSSLAIDHARRAIDRRRIQLNTPVARAPLEKVDVVAGTGDQT